MHNVRRVAAGLVLTTTLTTTALTTTMLRTAPPVAAAAGEPTEVAPGPWAQPEVVDRCRAVVETATADYEAITAAATRADGRVVVAMTSAAPFPVATYVSKVCVWSDRDHDARIDPDEEATVRAFSGPIEWIAATMHASLAVTDPGLADPTCARVWMYATYPDGHVSTKRTSIACVAAVPSAVVPEARHASWLAASALAVLGGAAVWRGRRGHRGRRGRRRARGRQRGATSAPSYL